MGQGGAGGADDTEDVDLVDAAPLLVGVVLDGALRADARVVDEDVEAAERLGGLGDRGPDRVVVGHVGADAGQRGGHLRVEVEAGDAGAATGQQRRGGQADAGGAAGDESGQPGELGVFDDGFAHGAVLQTGPSG